MYTIYLALFLSLKFLLTQQFLSFMVYLLMNVSFEMISTTYLTDTNLPNAWLIKSVTQSCLFEINT